MEDIVLKQPDGISHGVTSITDSGGHEVRPSATGSPLREGCCFHVQTTGSPHADLDHPAVLEFAASMTGWQVFVEATAPRAGYFRSRLRFGFEFPLEA